MITTAKSNAVQRSASSTTTAHTRAMTIENRIIFTIALLLNVGIAWRFASVYKIYAADALAQAFQAATVLYNDPAYLANIGFIWPPLSILIQLPLALIRSLVKEGLVAPLVTAFFSAINLAILNRTLEDFTQSRLVRYLVLAVYQITPIIFIYSINGASEMILVFWMLVALYYFQQMMMGRVRDVYALTIIGVCCGLGMLTRYEGAVLGLAFYLVILSYWLGHGKEAQRKKAEGADQALMHAPPQGPLAKMEAFSLYLIAPMFYSVALWLFFNWLIVGDPFYFLAGAGASNGLLNVNLSDGPMYHDLSKSFQFVISLVWEVYPGIFIALGGLGILFFARRSVYALGIATLTVSLLLCQVALLYVGQSPGSIRYIIYVIPLAVVGLVLIGQELKQAKLLPSLLVDAGLIAVLLASSYSSYKEFYTEPFVQKQDKVYMDTLQSRKANDTVAADRAVATYINSELLKAHPKAKILTDEQQAFAIILTSDSYTHFITRRQPNFTPILAHPQGNVDYILIPNVNDGTNLITARYPGMFDGKVPFLEFVHAFPGTIVSEWRLFRVLHEGETAQQTVPSVSIGSTTDISSTVATTSTTTTAADSTGWPTIAEENFDSPSQRFPTVQHSDWSNTYQNGHYQVQVNGRRSISYSVPLAHNTFQMQADVQIERGQAGLFFLIDQPNSFYRFLIDTEGHYRLEQQRLGVSEPLIDWTANQALHPGTQVVNRLEVRRAGDKISLYGNNVLLTTYTLPSSNAQRNACIGLAVNAQTGSLTGSALFDNLVVRGPAE